MRMLWKINQFRINAIFIPLLGVLKLKKKKIVYCIFISASINKLSVIYIYIYKWILILIIISKKKSKKKKKVVVLNLNNATKPFRWVFLFVW